MADRAQRVERALRAAVADGTLIGASAAVLEGPACAIVTVGHADLARRVPLPRDARFRLASVTKPVVAALAVALVEDGVLTLDDPIDRWLPELATPQVMRSARGPVDDLVPAAGPVRVRHVLDSTCGWGFPGDLSLPGVAGMLAAVGDGRDRYQVPEPDAWVARLAGVPLMFQPGERWLYDTSYDLLGVLLARAGGRPLPALMTERLLGPLGMDDTGFTAAPDALVVEAVRWQDGALRPLEKPDVRMAPRFPSGAGGLVGTIDDLARFARMLLDGGEAIAAMTADQLTAEQRSEGGGFLGGQSWGYGGAVDALGRYGWVGVTGTSLHVRRDQGTALVVLTSRELFEAEDTALLQSFRTEAAL